MEYRLHHIQLTLPPGGEQDARRFYGQLLGLPELPKPEELAARGGIWFGVGAVQLHFGVEDPGPGSRRHIALQVPDLAAIRGRLLSAGFALEEAIPLNGMARCYCRDPFHNRLELLEITSDAGFA